MCRRLDGRLDRQDLEQALGRPGGRRDLAADLESSPRLLAASTANSRNCDSRPGVMVPASTSWAPTQSTTTTLANTRKIAMAVRMARALVEETAAW